MIELLFCFLGIVLGIILGLVPGLHINNLLPLLLFLSLTSTQSFFFIIAVSMAFVFSSAFPAILLGVPNEDTALNVLPGHKMVLEGNAYSAIHLSLISAFLAMLFSLPFLVFFLNALSIIYSALRGIVPYALAAVLVFMMFSDKKASILIVLLSSVLGMLTFKVDTLLPILTGFFGLSTILISLMGRTEIPVQKLTLDIKIGMHGISLMSFSACFLSSIFGFMPAISSSIVGAIGGILRKFDPEEFLALLSGTNSVYMIYSLFALVLIHKTRSGSAVFLSQIIENESVFFILGIILLSGAVSFIVCLNLIRPLIKIYGKMNYRSVSMFSIIFLILINFVLAGPFGLAVLLASTSIGLLCNLLAVKRINCMAALIVPTIVLLMQ
jgi:putative membrane protein